MYGPADSTSDGGSMDIRHVFVGSFIWYLPKLTGASRFLRKPFGDWQLNGVIHLQTGPYGSVVANTPILGERMADYLGGPVLMPNPGANGWINPAAWGVPAQALWGSEGSGTVPGPGMQIYDLSVTKFFPVRENIRLRFRAEFFNAFNCVNFQPPAGTSTTSGFGTISSAYPPRNIEFGLKLDF